MGAVVVLAERGGDMDDPGAGVEGDEVGGEHAPDGVVTGLLGAEELSNGGRYSLPTSAEPFISPSTASSHPSFFASVSRSDFATMKRASFFSAARTTT